MTDHKLNWPRPAAYISHHVMSEDELSFTKNKDSIRHTPLYRREDVEELLKQHRRLWNLGVPNNAQETK